MPSSPSIRTLAQKAVRTKDERIARRILAANELSAQWKGLESEIHNAQMSLETVSDKMLNGINELVELDKLPKDIMSKVYEPLDECIRTLESVMNEMSKINYKSLR